MAAKKPDKTVKNGIIFGESLVFKGLNGRKKSKKKKISSSPQGLSLDKDVIHSTYPCCCVSAAGL